MAGPSPISSLLPRHPDGLCTTPHHGSLEHAKNGYANANAIVAVLRGDSNIKGTVTFEQADESSDTTISWDITGHDANAERGMHVHAFGDNTNGCTSAGPHC
jgi:Cu/Zn superoxide dismutase